MRTFILGLAAALGACAASNEGIALNSQGLGLYQQGRYAGAEACYRRALEAFPGEQALSRAIVKENLGAALTAQGRLSEAEALLVQAFGELKDLTGPGSRQTGQAVNRLASVYLGEHRYREAVGLLENMIGAADDVTLVTTYGNLAVAALGLADNAKAEEYARLGLAAADRALPREDVGRAAVLNNLAQACRFTGKYLEAERNYREAIAIWESKLGPAHPDLGRGLMNLAAFYHDRGREAGAEQLYLRAYEILDQSDPLTALVVRNELADVLRGELRYTEAEKLARATLVQMEETMQSEDPRLQRAWMNWMRLQDESHRTAAARAGGRVSGSGYVPGGR
jgi:tetratricopeptide (TPR) repeat protein